MEANIFNYISILYQRLFCIALILISVSVDTFALEAKKASGSIKINGIADDTSWELASWQPINQLILGRNLNKDDFSGRFKILWDAQQLYLLVEITDDILLDQYADPLHRYWDDDCLEIFIDENASGGNHQFNFNAFAYHVALDNQVVDIGEKSADGSVNAVLLNDHITSVWRREESKPHNVIWEVAIRVFDDNFSIEQQSPLSVKLSMGKVLGFMLAYCDNDRSKEREHFIGSTNIKPINGTKNLGYITADVFDKLILID